MNQFKGKNVLVLGLGVHGGGVAVATWMVQHGAKVTVSDTKSATELASSLKALKSLLITYVLGEHPSSLLKNCDLIIQNPGVPKTAPILATARKLHIPIENEASLFLKLCPSQLIIGVTGSRGKSTTTALLGQIFKSWQKSTEVAGNIRDQVMFGVLDKIKKTVPVILELSSWQLEVVGEHTVRLPYALITNIFPEHLNRYRSFADYRLAKTQIFKGQTKHDNVILNFDNVYTKQFAKIVRAQIFWFSTKAKVDRGSMIVDKTICFRFGPRKPFIKIILLKEISLLGEHNLSNVLGAVTVAMASGVPVAKIVKAVKKFKGLHDRLEKVASIQGVDFYNDTTATSPEAVMSALNTLAPRPIILIAGGVDKKLNYTALAKLIKQKVKQLILLPGTASDKIIKGLGRGYQFKMVDGMNQAVALAGQIADSQDVVLLSPGAASFNLFKHEFDRGEQFKSAVAKLKKK